MRGKAYWNITKVCILPCFIWDPSPRNQGYGKKKENVGEVKEEVHGASEVISTTIKRQALAAFAGHRKMFSLYP